MNSTNVRSGGISQAGRSLSEPGRRVAGPGNLDMTSKRKTPADGYAERAFARIIHIHDISKLMVFITRTIICSTTTGSALRLE
ncbi:hypothetical protein FOWG_18015 [Fusarium oxysporum f. sp. lycopersici MN25]|nr:hypothetical protein FOWG_18015 [Fusarium oxysporum f. sp. lycopersici MN25]